MLYLLSALLTNDSFFILLLKSLPLQFFLRMQMFVFLVIYLHFRSDVYVVLAFLLMEPACSWHEQHVMEFIFNHVTETSAFAHLKELPSCISAVFVFP